MARKTGVRRALGLAIIASLLLCAIPTLDVSGEASISPSNPLGWGMFFGTTGDIRIDITESCWAVRIEVPREFLEGTSENDTSFVESNISNDYFYYSVIDQSQYYPYDNNAPYTVEIWNPPRYLTPECTGLFYNFTAPKYVLLKSLVAPGISGIYNFTVWLAQNRGLDGKPIFPADPSKILQIPVSMREDPASISGYVCETAEYGSVGIRAKGIVYAIEVTTGKIGRGFVNPETGFFNITGLYKGDYRLEGSAGISSETGYAYAPTTYPMTVPRGKGENTPLISDFPLNRGCIINGTITYVDAFNPSISIQPLESPYIKALNYQGLNYTVEAYDASDKIVASRTYNSLNLQTEPYALIYRNGTRYVGYPALGTEYAGFGPGTYTIKIWVYGFTVPTNQIKTVTISSHGTKNNVGTSRIPYGAVVSGTIRLFHGSVLETPRDGEVETYGSATGKHFGGNMLVEMFSNEGVLKGLAVYNRTDQDGVVQYSDFSSGEDTTLLRFYILGFSEHYNKSYSGRWVIGSYPGPSPWDYGLEGGTCYIRVWIRGYVQEDVEEFTLAASSNRTVTIDMQKGGAFQVTVESWNTRVRTRRPQAPQPWRFLDFCPAPRLRVYFYRDSVEVGYSESILSLDFPGVTLTTATLNFTGHNWPVDYIIFHGYTPSSVDAGNYTLKAYTYGYIQQETFTTPYVSLGDLCRSFVRLFIAGEIHGTVLLEMNGLFVSLTENATVRPEVILTGELKGVDVVNATIDSSRFDFSTAGFYGKGHFFYVDPEGIRWRDNGFDIGNYTVFVPEFGYDRLFSQTLDIYANVPDLNTMVGVIFHIDRMIKISGIITGLDDQDRPVALVWAFASTDGRTYYSFDGDFYLHTPQSTPGTFPLTFSCPGYIGYSQTFATNDQISNVVILLTQSGAPFP